MKNKKYCKNIVILIPSLKLGGGAEKIATQIGTELLKKGYNIIYFTYYSCEKKYKFSGVEYCLNDNLNSSFIQKIIRFFLRAYKIKKFCSENNIDIVISFMEEGNFPAILSKLFYNVSRIIISIHHSISDYKKSIFDLFIKILYKYADDIVVLTTYEKNNLIQNYHIDKNKISIIPNGIDINNINSAKTESLGEYQSLFSDKFSFISIGRLEKIKNQKLMVKSFLKLNEKYPNTQLIILGDGGERKNLENIINDNVKLLGNHDNVFKFLYNSNCFILTSFSEAFSISILEAMSCQLPVISTKTQGANEIIGNKFGLLVNNNIDDLYKEMENIYLSKELREHYKNLSINHVNIYDIKQILKKRENLLA